MNVIEQKLACYRNDLRNGAKGYVLQQGGVYRNREYSELLTRSPQWRVIEIHFGMMCIKSQNV